MAISERMQELVWLLLPIAAASGWLAAIRSARKAESAGGVPASALRSDYFRGLNYLLNEQPDKAIEVFVKVLEVDSETVETHLALGNLFRRRGEVDRAIRIHQNLIARQNLSAQERGDALLELGQDYMRAGLLDRAEGLFQELVRVKPFGARALRHLVDIYQQEKDWDKAADAARQLELITGKPYGGVIAHYYCEQAEERSRDGDHRAALATVQQALDTSSQCVRASMLEGSLLEDLGDYRGAVRAYKRVEQQDPDYLPEVIEPLARCFEALGRPAEIEEYLAYVLERYGGISSALLLAEIKTDREGKGPAIRFLTEQLRRRPSVRGLDHLIHLSLAEVDGTAREYFHILKDLTHKLLENRPVYKCDHCGFSGRTLHWQCPSCKLWGQIKPIQGVEGE
jgi:lipopolysaccharide biosynthesis regulator YciM